MDAPSVAIRNKSSFYQLVKSASQLIDILLYFFSLEKRKEKLNKNKKKKKTEKKKEKKKIKKKIKEKERKNEKIQKTIIDEG